MNKKRTIIILMLIVLLPLTFLGWQGYTIVKNEQQLAKAQQSLLLDSQLLQFDTQIHRYLQEQANDWIRLLPRWQIDTVFLRQQLKESPRIRQLFVLDGNKKRIYPDENQAITRDEKQLIDRLQSLWNDPDRLFSNGKQNISTQEEANSSPSYRKALSSRAISQTTSSYSGWHLWHWESGANLIFWWTSPSGKTIGLELESSRVMADIIGILPSTSNNKSMENCRIRLLDEKGHIVYQWGKFEAKKAFALKTRPLQYPLSHWKLEYYGSATQTQSASMLGLFTLLGLVALTLSGLVFYLYREHTRDMRLSTQRVQFVSQVSHELKTPLTNIRMYAEMLENTLDDDPQPQKYAKIVVDESQRLTRLISNVLSFSRPPRIHKQHIAVTPIIHKVVDAFMPSYRSKQLVVNVKLDDNDTLLTDPDIFEQIINNLLSNVEKYANNGKQLDINSRCEDAQYIVQIRDYGPGIPPKEQKRIFKAFYRLSNQLTEGVSGTGIGLTIARQQAQQLGGSLQLINVPTGACFELALPHAREQQ